MHAALFETRPQEGWAGAGARSVGSSAGGGGQGAAAATFLAAPDVDVALDSPPWKKLTGL